MHWKQQKWDKARDVERFLGTLLCETLSSIRKDIDMVWFPNVLGRFERGGALWNSDSAS